MFGFRMEIRKYERDTPSRENEKRLAGRMREKEKGHLPHLQHPIQSFEQRMADCHEAKMCSDRIKRQLLV
jgi:hypothetical protein